MYDPERDDWNSLRSDEDNGNPAAVVKMGTLIDRSEDSQIELTGTGSGWIYAGDRHRR